MAYTNNEKYEIVLEYLKSESTKIETLTKYCISYTELDSWVEWFEAGAKKALAGNQHYILKSSQAKICSIKNEIDLLEQIIQELSIEKPSNGRRG